jgi:ABC-type multidrug transport system ATPase subunit
MSTKLVLLTSTFAQKNFRLFFRSQKSLVLFLLAPLLACAFLAFTESVFRERVKYTAIRNPPAATVAKIPRCTKPENCTSLGYFVIGDPEDYVHDIMKSVAAQNDLEFGRDVRMIMQGSPADFSEYVAAHANQTQIAAIFCTTAWNISYGAYSASIPCQFERLTDQKLVFYSIYYNMTLGFEIPYLVKIGTTFPTNHMAVSLKQSIDQAIGRHFGDPEFVLDIRTASFPATENKLFKSYDILSNFGSLFMYLPFAFGFLFMSSEMISEKARGVKLYLTISGLPTSAYLLSWTILNLALTTYCTATLYLGGYVCGFIMFRNVPASFWLSFLGLSGFTMNALASVVVAISPADKSGYVLSYLVLMFGFLFQVIMNVSGAMSMFYHPRRLFWWVRTILEFYPGFNFTKIFVDLVHFAGSTISTEKGMFVQGPGFEWADFWKTYDVFGVVGGEEIPAISNSFWLLGRNLVLIYFFSIVFEQTLGSNQGRSINPFRYFVGKIGATLEYFRKIFRPKAKLSMLHPSVAAEKKRIEAILKERDSKMMESLIIKDVSLRYGAFGGLGSKKAVDDVSLCIERGELMTILGENGAGKTSLIKILMGLESPESGTVYMLGTNTNKQTDDARDLASLCPQSDICWEELTPMEHLELFAILRDPFNPPIRQEAIVKVVKSVELMDKASEPVKTLSGGMRRRLSIALAILYDPQIIIFDEPTVGLDPLKRDKVLKILKKLKEKRIVILTTHSMEEADLLSDRIAFMKNGKLKCIGTSLTLKEEFSDRFLVSLILRKDAQVSNIKRYLAKEAGVRVRIRSIFDKKLELEASKADLNKILEAIEAFSGPECPIGCGIEEWGFAQASLEHIFERLNSDA